MDFQNLGKHCTEFTCKQKDFLPFTCKYCLKVFCLDHRSPSTHECTQSNKGDIKIFNCPLCLSTVKYDSGLMTENDFFSIHQATDCKPQEYAQKKEEMSKRCPVKGCKNKLTKVGSYKCPKCTQVLCLQHRFEDDHICEKPKYQPNAYQQQVNNKPQPKPQTSTISQQSRPQPQSQPVSTQSSTIQQRQQQQQQPQTQSRPQQQQQSQPVNNSNGNSASQAFAEICYQCGAGFHHVEELIKHCENYHF